MNDQISRRSILAGTSLFLASPSSALERLQDAMDADAPLLKAGIITDVHYADADPRGTRIYRDSLKKLRRAVAAFRRSGVDFAIETGDFVDAPADTTAEIELGFLRTVNREFIAAGAPTRYVLGNHCVNAMTKAQFLETVGQAEPYLTWDQGGWHWVILDACNRKDGVSYAPGNFQWTDTEVPGSQREWLQADLEKTQLPTVVFVHQRLDLPQGDNYAIWSSEEVRRIMERSGKVAAVIMGHSHKNFAATIKGIPYLVTAALVEQPGAENTGYSILKGHPGGVLELEGFASHGGHPFRTNKR